MCQSSAPQTHPHPQAACGCGHSHEAGAVASNVGQTKPASHDLDFPPVPFPSADIFALVGEAGLRELVRCHYQLMLGSDIAHMFPPAPAAIDAIIQRSADFIIESCGGPTLYSASRGHGCMRTRHFPFTIDEAGRDIWLDCLWQAFDQAATPARAREALWDWLEPMSIRMINRRTLRGQPPRHPYGAVRQSRQEQTAAAVCPR